MPGFNIAELLATFDVRGEQSVVRATQRVQAGFTRAGEAATRASAGVDKATASLSRADRAAIAASASASKQRIAALQLTAAHERYNAVLADTNATMARSATAEAALIRAQERYNAAVAKSPGALGRALGSIRDMDKAQVSLATRMTAAGRAINHSVTLVTAAAAALAVHEASQFQKSMTLIQTAGGETAEKAAQIADGIKQVAQETGTSLDQLGEGIYTVAKAGAKKWSASEQLEVLRAAAQGAKAENVDLGTAVNALTSVMLGYGMSAKQAVKAENEIIRASGLSKTTYADFAESLANVIPLASSLHISFAQVAGAEATMTQHGETAQRATENLSNLITNLAGQNNVAAQAMQQLGINTVALSKNLGKRGLTGTLDVVLDAVAKNSKGGLVVVDAFKKAQNATHDLQIELAHMGGQLKANSQAFASGKMSYKDYRAFVRSLGGDQYVLGKNFLTTVSAAKGFNSQLKSGNPAVRTTATELQKALGGVTGMRTALMLSGPSQKQFAANVKQIGKAALESGADVLGWNKTAQTLAVKTDKAKASMQVLAVEVGDSLLPMMSKLAQKGEDAIHWVDGLSHTQKQVLGWSLGVVAAMGPVLAIGGRLVKVGGLIGTFTSTTATELATLAGASEASALRIGAAMRSATAALSGAGVGLALGEITKNSGDATKAVGILGSTMAGAALGMSAGPWGAAIGAAAGGLTALATDLFGARRASDDASAAAKRAAQAWQHEQTTVDNLRDSLVKTNGAISQLARSNIVQGLQGVKVGNTDAMTELSKLGFTAKQVTDAILGLNGKGVGPLETKLQTLYYNGKLSEGALKTLNSALGVSQTTAGKAAVAAEQLAQANGKTVVHAKNAKQAVNQYGTALTGSTAAAKLNQQFIEQSAQAYVKQAKKIQDTSGSYKKANTWLQAHIDKLKADATAAGYNAAQVDGLLSGYKSLPSNVAIKINADVKSAQTNIAQLKTDVDRFLVTGHPTEAQNGFLQSAFDNADALELKIEKLGKMKATPRVEAEISDAQGAIAEIERKISAVTGRTVPIDVDQAPAQHKITALQKRINKIKQGKVPGLTANSFDGERVIEGLQDKINAIKQAHTPVVSIDASPAITAIRRVGNALEELHGKTVIGKSFFTSSGKVTMKAAGGPITQGTTGTADDVPIMASKGEYVINARAAARYRRLLDAINFVGQGHAVARLAAGGPATGEIGRELRGPYTGGMQL